MNNTNCRLNDLLLKKASLRFIVFVLFVLSQAFVNEVYSNSKFNHLLVQDGLSQSTVYCMLQDSDGFIWIGTRDGLNRYDGYEFKVYRANKSDSTTISDNQVFSLIEDREGQIWVGTNNGVSVYSKNTDSFTQYFHDENDASSLNNNHIYALLLDSKGSVWIGTDGGGVNVFDPIKNSFSSIFIDEALTKSKIRTMVELTDGQIWIGTKGDGIVLCSEGVIPIKIHIAPN